VEVERKEAVTEDVEAVGFEDGCDAFWIDDVVVSQAGVTEGAAETREDSRAVGSVLEVVGVVVVIGSNKVPSEGDQIGVQRVDHLHGVLDEARFIERTEVEVGELRNGEVVEGRGQIGDVHIMADECQVETPGTPGIKSRRSRSGQGNSASG